MKGFKSSGFILAETLLSIGLLSSSLVFVSQAELQMHRNLITAQQRVQQLRQRYEKTISVQDE